VLYPGDGIGPVAPLQPRQRARSKRRGRERKSRLASAARRGKARVVVGAETGEHGVGLRLVEALILAAGQAQDQLLLGKSDGLSQAEFADQTVLAREPGASMRPLA